MFVETDYNQNLFTESGLPCILTTISCSYNQEDVERGQGMSSHQILWVIDGEGCMEINGKTIILEPGKGYFCRAFLPHKYYRTGESFHTGWITFTGLDGILKHYNVKDFFIFDVSDTFLQGVHSLERSCYGYSTTLSRSADTYSILISLFTNLHRFKQPFCKQVNTYMETHFAEDLYLERIADAFCISRYTLCHKYFKECGTTVMETLKYIRLDKAKQLLETTALPISRIADICGFASPSYFAKNFRQVTGLSPHEYRHIKQDS